MSNETLWMVAALCHDRDHDPEWWFPAHKDDRSIRSVKNICRACPVQTECLGYALDHREQSGVWGGTTPDERDIILYGRRRPHRNWI